jgi:hypothetical protein
MNEYQRGAQDENERVCKLLRDLGLVSAAVAIENQQRNPANAVIDLMIAAIEREIKREPPLADADGYVLDGLHDREMHQVLRFLRSFKQGAAVCNRV